MQKPDGDFRKLLKMLKDFGVTEFESGDLKIRMAGPIIGTSTSPSKTTPRKSSKADEIAEAGLLKEEIEHRQAQLDQMVIEDPAEYERLISEGDLVDGQQREEDSSQH